ncbi:MAG: folate family ECF transporter S component [Clostridia bacterium]|nr:folate family ECF transporter S component [Clostridia bacterium]
MRRKLTFLAYAALMAALSILLGKFLAIGIGSDIRISFENLPLFIVSIFMGPVWGMATGVVADLLGCLLKGYAIIPLLTVAQALMGLLPGLIIRLVFRNKKPLSIIVSVSVTHLLLSIGMKTYVLHHVYGMAFLPLLGWRALSYLPIIPLEIALCVLLSKNPAIQKIFHYSDHSDMGGIS